MDPKSVGAFWPAFMTRFGIVHSMTTANHPEAEGVALAVRATYLVPALQQAHTGIRS